MIDKNKTIASIEAEVQLPKSVWIDIQSTNPTSNRTFIKIFKRSPGQELMIRAAKWGKQKGLTHIYLKGISEPAKRMIQKLIELKIVSSKGKILRIPRQLNLKKNRWFENPIIRRTSLAIKQRRKHVRI